MNKRSYSKNTIVSLVDELQGVQTELDMKDGEFAHLLGISRTLWVMTRNGDRRVNISLLRGVAKAFPNFDEHILKFLRSTNGGSA